MASIDVNIVRLEPMRVATAYGFGQNPEEQAWDKILAFVMAKGLLEEEEPFLTYGFNNPNPSKGTPNYGYEIWLPVTDDVEPEGDIRIEHFKGGLYAVAQFKGIDNIGEVWRQLARWRESSQYKPGHHQWLEELLTPVSTPPEEFVFNLYLPILE